MLLQSLFSYLYILTQADTYFIFLSASDTKHSALSRDLFALNWKRAATTNKKFHLFVHKIKYKIQQKIMKEERKQTKKP